MGDRKTGADQKVVVLISISSDIGAALAKRYVSEGYTVVGTYRSINQLSEISAIPNCHLFHCDIGDRRSISEFVKGYAGLGLPWDTFVSCVGNPLPLKAFFKCDFDEWSDSVRINAIEQLRVLHQLYPYRSQKNRANVVLLAAGGVNNAVVDFSAYTVSKIMLIKMCEFLDAENDDLNIFIVGPGWTKTKTHDLILKNVERTSPKYRETQDFMQNRQGTSMDDIYGCIRWLSEQGKEVASGRNFSVVNDEWQGTLSGTLSSELRRDRDMYKLRRHRNDFLA